MAKAANARNINIFAMNIQLIFISEWQKKILPINSFRQLFDSVVISLAIGFFSTKILFPWPEGFFITTVFAWLGTLPIMNFVLPARLRIDAVNPTLILENVENILVTEHYKKIAVKTVDGMKFEVNLPKFLKWKESDINIAKNRELIIIDGPILILRIMKKRLEALAFL